MFYNRLSKILYNGFLIRDISLVLSILSPIKEAASIYEYYTINGNDKPETVAYNFYGDCKYATLILMMNNMIDPLYDWVLSYNELLAFVDNKYISLGGRNGIHHYAKDGFIVGENGVGVSTFTNLNYEEELNENKRIIKILKPEYIPIVEKQIKEILSENL